MRRKRRWRARPSLGPPAPRRYRCLPKLRSFLLLLCRGFRVGLEDCLETIETLVPELLVETQPLACFLEGFRREGADVLPAPHPSIDHAGPFQNLDMLRGGRE